MTGRLKVLISAYACSPYQGSEPGVGWGFVSALARHHDLWVIVEEEKFREEIERYLEENPEFGQSVRFFFLHKKRNRPLRKLWPPSYYWYYRRWHEEALRLGKQLHSEVGFDLAHQLTMVGFREPGYLWKLGIPFVWGPVGAMGLFPWRFLPAIGAFGCLYYAGYNLMNLLHMYFLKRPRLAAKTAGKGLVSATPENRTGIRRLWGCDSTVIAEVGLPAPPANTPTHRVTGDPLRIVWTGLHIPRKALNLALQSLSKLGGDVAWELHVLGEGPRTGHWKELTAKLGIQQHCIFHGWVPRAQVLHVMGKSHLMFITSLRDLTSTVTVEALSLGLPVLTMDHCGFSHVVTDECGIKIPVSNPAGVVADFSDALTRLYRDEPLRQRLARGAVARAEDFAWERKAKQINSIYEGVLRENMHRP